MNSLTMENFVRLMLVRLAVNSKIIDLTNSNLKYACLPTDYKQRIAYILTEDNGWKNEFSKIINMDEYFRNHFEWEEKLSNSLANELAVLGREYEYDFVSNRIKILYTQDIIDSVMSCFSDEEIIEKMDHFVTLLDNYYLSREYLEKDSDHYAETIGNMCQVFQSHLPKENNNLSLKPQK